MRRVTGLVAALMLSAAACSWQGPALAGYEGLQLQVQRFYSGRATERSASCPDPRITTVTRAEVVEETPERVVMFIRYHWRDDGQEVDGGSRRSCQGFGGRRFTFVRTGGSGLEVESMSGRRLR